MATPSAVELNVSSIYPKHPERICWGCEKLCPANHLMCRETRAAHPVELFGDDWWEVSDGLPATSPPSRHDPATARIHPENSYDSNWSVRRND